MGTRNSSFACLACAWCMIGCMVAQAQTERFVSVAGNDASAGTMDQPWRHIQFALEQALPSWTIHVREGVYNEEISFVSGGTMGLTLTLRNYLNEVAVIDGEGLNADALLTIRDHANIDVIGLEFRNNIHNDAIGILVDGACGNIRLLGLDVHDIHFSADPNASVSENTNAQPIIVFGSNSDITLSDLTIADCEVHDCRPGFSEGLAINGNVTDFALRNNHVHHITNIGIGLIGHEGVCADPLIDQARNGSITGNDVHDCISPYAMCGGIYVDGGRDLLIENNTTHDGMWGIEVGCEHVGKSASNIVVRNNRIFNNSGSGLMLGGYDYPTGSGRIEDCLVRHNTVYHNDTQNAFEGELTLAYSENCTIAHNIMYADNVNSVLFYLDDALPLSPGLVLDHNLWYCPGGTANAEVNYHGDSYSSYADYQNGTGQDSNSPFGDPLFADASLPAPVLNIASTSPARDAGSSLFSAEENELDMDGEPRVNGMVDIGSDEYFSITHVGPSPIAAPWSLCPDPSTGVFVLNGPATEFNGHCRVRDGLGRVVHTQRLSTMERTVFDLSHCGAGVYFISIEDTGGPGKWIIRAIVQ